MEKENIVKKVCKKLNLNYKQLWELKARVSLNQWFIKEVKA